MTAEGKPTRTKRRRKPDAPGPTVKQTKVARALYAIIRATEDNPGGEPDWSQLSAEDRKRCYALARALIKLKEALDG